MHLTSKNNFFKILCASFFFSAGEATASLQPVLSFSPVNTMTIFLAGSATQKVTIENTGNLTATNLHVEKVQDPLFILQDNCSNKSLAPKSKCDFSVKFTGTALQNGQQMLKIIFDPNQTSAAVSLPYEIIQADPLNTLTFVNIDKLMQTQTGHNVTQSVTIKNNGSALIHLASNSFIALPLDSPLHISMGNDNTCAGRDIIPNGTCSFQITFNAVKSIQMARDLIGVKYTAGEQAVTLSQYVAYTTSAEPNMVYIPKGVLGVVNQCHEPVWIQLKPLADRSVPGEEIVKINAGNSYEYSIPDAGIPAFNLWAKLGCDAEGTHCEVGQSLNRVDHANDCDPSNGCQPNIDTAFEGTFGCVLSGADRDKCVKNPSNGQPLTNPTFFDLSLVDGYTFPMSLRVIPNENEENVECHDMSTPNFNFEHDYPDCPQTENLTAKSANWDVNKNLVNWNYDTISQNAANKIVNPFWGKDLQETIVAIGKDNWQKGVQSLQESSRVSVDSILNCADTLHGNNRASIALDSVDLRLQNPNTGRHIGCSSPKTIMLGNRHWGGLGIGNQCVEKFNLVAMPNRDEGPVFVKSPVFSANPDYLDANLYYSNPFTDSDLKNPGQVVNNTKTNENWNKRWNNLSAFCAENAEFCKGDGNAPRPGLAAIVGHAAAIANSQYVQAIKKFEPNIYTWQYDDAAGTRVCNKRPKIIITICSGNQ